MKYHIPTFDEKLEWYRYLKIFLKQANQTDFFDNDSLDLAYLACEELKTNIRRSALPRLKCCQLGYSYILAEFKNGKSFWSMNCEYSNDAYSDEFHIPNDIPIKYCPFCASALPALKRNNFPTRALLGKFCICCQKHCSYCECFPEICGYEVDGEYR